MPNQNGKLVQFLYIFLNEVTDSMVKIRYLAPIPSENRAKEMEFQFFKFSVMNTFVVSSFSHSSLAHVWVMNSIRILWNPMIERWIVNCSPSLIKGFKLKLDMQPLLFEVIEFDTSLGIEWLECLRFSTSVSNRYCMSIKSSKTEVWGTCFQIFDVFS